MKKLLSKKNFIHFFSVIICLLCTCTACESQSADAPPLKFSHITSDQGLSNRNVSSMMKDSRGFLWVGTIDGLNRYDGYDFKIFRNDPRDSTSIGFGWPLAMAEDKNGIIWIAPSSAKALSAYDPNTGKFKRYGEIPMYKNLLPDDLIYALYVDENNRLWMGTGGQGVYVLDQKTREIKHYMHDAHNAASFGSDSAYCLCGSQDGYIYASTAYGFDRLNVTTGEWSHYHLKRDHPNDQSYFVNSLFCDSKNQLWICTYEGLKCFNPVTQQFSELRHLPHDAPSLSSDSTVSICETPDDRLWIRTNNGLDIYDRRTGKFASYFHSEENPNSISSIDFFAAPYYSSYDHSGVVWFKSDYSVDYADLLPVKFHVLHHDEKNSNSLVSDAIQYIYEDHDGEIFVCTLDGIDTYDPATKRFDRYQPDPAINYLLRHREADIMFQDKDGTYWIEVDQDKLISYNPQEHHASIYHFKKNHAPDSLGIGYIWTVCQDSNGIIWFGGDSYVSAFHPETKTFKTYLRFPDQLNMFENGASRIMQLDDGRIFFAGLGLSYYDSKSDKLNPLSFPGNNNEALKILLQSNCITSLKAGDDKLWLGTMGNGLFFFDAKTGACRNFSSKDGLPSDVVWGILQEAVPSGKDAHCNLWLSTNNGLCRFTPPADPFDENKEGIFRNYNVGDGIPIKEFAWNTYLQSKDGTMYFGMYISSSGLVYFNPDSLKDNPFVPAIYITDFKLFNKSVEPGGSNNFLESPIDVTKEITLTYKQNVISFAFAALSFVHPENNHYAYKLDGFDKDWIYTDASKRFANYTNLDAGTYTFEVKGSNNDGVWNETPTTLKLIITPPFWKTWWFRMLIGLAIAGIIYGIYRYRLQQVIRLQLIRNNIASDLHDEIGSTLNSISILSTVAKQQAGKSLPALDQIGANSRKVIEAMNDIVWTINPENDNFEKILVRMRSFAHQVMKGKEIEFMFHADERLDALSMPMQTRKNFYLIFKEATINIAKYSAASHANFSVTNSDHQIHLTIRDNGIGFDTTSKSSGNGMKNMQRRAKEINADLKIESSVGEGTNIELTLKVK